ncbi:MAG: MotA/TolQ/ExbB proton channel family protein [Polyangia bacterium]|jgi:biopolymer transport protein ExbB
MNITQRFLGFTLLGAEWVLWLLVVLSCISLAIMIERAWFFLTHNFDGAGVGEQLKKLLRGGKVGEARKLLEGSDCVEAIVINAGLAEVDRGSEAVSEAMLSAKARERLRLDRNLAVLGTLGNNTPFIGLFGTVLGIIKASHDLTGSAGGGAASAAVMAGVFEALVATAIGLLVAIPAVIGFNYFQRRVRATISKVDSLAHLVLSELKGEDQAAAKKPSLSEVK